MKSGGGKDRTPRRGPPAGGARPASGSYLRKDRAAHKASPYARKPERAATERAPSPFARKADRAPSPFAHKAKRAPAPSARKTERAPSPFARKPQPEAAPTERGPQRKGGRYPGRRDQGPGRKPERYTPRAAAPEPKRAPRVERPSIRPMTESVVFPVPAPARIGEWLLTTRPDAELDLLEEIAFAGKAQGLELPRIAGPALVAVKELPGKPRVELAFARQGFPVAAFASLDDPRAPSILAASLRDALPIAQGRAARSRGMQPWALDAWVPDDDRTNPQSAAAEALGAQTLAVFRTMAPAWSEHYVTDARAAWQENGLLAQICVAGDRAYIGASPAREAPSLAPGGRLRVHLPQHAPSRAAAKLLEAFLWLDRAPAAGELCVDLGAAPGGWSWVLLERGAKVLAIDPAKLDPLVMKKRGLTHLREDAFRFEPEESVDWLVADMAWRPLEAAALYGKWARRGWARLLIANIKLPMKKKAEYLLRVRDILTQSGWQNLRVRQLYHDREEVTVAGVRL